MEVKILGTGCPKCKKLFAAAEKAIKESGINVELIKIEDMQKIIETGVLSTPALMIDSEIKCSGRIPSSEEISEWLRSVNH